MVYLVTTMLKAISTIRLNFLNGHTTFFYKLELPFAHENI